MRRSFLLSLFFFQAFIFPSFSTPPPCVLSHGTAYFQRSPKSLLWDYLENDEEANEVSKKENTSFSEVTCVELSQNELGRPTDDVDGGGDFSTDIQERKRGDDEVEGPGLAQIRKMRRRPTEASPDLASIRIMRRSEIPKPGLESIRIMRRSGNEAPDLGSIRIMRRSAEQPPIPDLDSIRIMRRSVKTPDLGSLRVLRRSSASSEVQPDLGSIRIMRRSFDEQPVRTDLGSIRIMRRSEKPMGVELKDNSAQVVSNGDDGGKSYKDYENYLATSGRIMLRENRATPSLDSLRIM